MKSMVACAIRSLRSFISACLALMLCCGPAMATPAPAARESDLPLVIDGDVIIAQDMEENYCALTFDDGPSIYTPRLLDMLAAYGIPATFFMVGRNAEHFPDLVRRVEAEGHEVANHSYSHPNLRKLPVERKRAELANTNAILRNIGVTPRFVRPPYGAFDEATEAIARDLGLSIVLWSVDSKDWKRLPASYLNLPTTQGFVYPEGEMRGVFLFHDIHERTVNDLPRIVSQLVTAGCKRFVTMSEYMDKMDHRGLRMARRHKGRYYAEIPGVEQLAAAQAAFSAANVAASATADLESAQQNSATSESVPQTIQPAVQYAWPAGTAPLPFARCSKPGTLAYPQHQHADVQSAPDGKSATVQPTTTASPNVEIQPTSQPERQAG